jgi:tetratricopeptide (TPR) repeat protein
VNRALVITILLVATTARANVWQRALDRGAPSASNDRYIAELQTGDDEVYQAHSRMVAVAQVRAHVSAAEAAYRRAAAARPDQAEPYFRIATLIESFYVDCTDARVAIAVGVWYSPLCDTSRQPNFPKIKVAVEAWDQFEKRAPLDPRATRALFNRAIMRTKLVSTAGTAKTHLEGALRDYKAIIDRADGLSVELEQVWGNLAETYMMLGRLDEAIDAYSEAIKLGPNGPSTHYGFAVALDRDERGTTALEVIRGQGVDAFNTFKNQFAEGRVFYVPEGEQFYYFALVSEAFGYLNDSIASWRLFLKSGAHPQYQARAKAHLDALLAQQRLHPRPPPPPDILESFP